VVTAAFVDPDVAVLFFVGLFYLGLKLLELYDRVLAPALGSDPVGDRPET
jgi:hypothetical protein